MPVGLSRYREGLYQLEPFEREDALSVLSLIHRYQDICFEKYGLHFIHASDEWYVLADMELPMEDRYDGYLQLENGVGMLRLLMDEFDEAYRGYIEENDALSAHKKGYEQKEIAIATGYLAYPFIRDMCKRTEELFPDFKVNVYPIKNDFFGELITVSGLLTGQDILSQLKGRRLGKSLYLPQNVLRSGEDVFLDDMHLSDLEKALQLPLNIVKSSGYEFFEALKKEALS